MLQLTGINFAEKYFAEEKMLEKSPTGIWWDVHFRKQNENT